ncbi:hypothetical protein AB0N20_22550 [Streptomyces griseoincarnatus]
MAVAGCGTHACRLVDSSGATLTEAEILTEVEWTRALDDYSTARVLLTPTGNCCERIADVRAWRTWLHIYRDGTPVWQGPMLQPEWRGEDVELTAVDILALLDRRVPHQSMTFGDSDLMDIATWLIEDAFAPDDPGHRLEVLGPSGVRGGRAYVKDIGQTGDHLRELAETGLDYTAVGSRIILLPETHRQSVGRLSDADLPDGLVVAEDGAAVATRVIVAGDDEGNVLGEAGGTDPYLPLLERYVEQTSIKTDAAAADAARALLRSSYPTPVFINTEEVTLSPDAAVEVPLLVPGWCLDVTSSATCRAVAQRFKITGVKVTEDGGTESSPGGESVQVQVAATGAEA